MLQHTFFPDRNLPDLVEVYPFLTTRWSTHPDRAVRLDAHRLSVKAEPLYHRIESHSLTTNLTDNPRFVSAWFSWWNDLEMTKQRGKQATTERDERPQWAGFLERKLTDDELVQCDEWKPTHVELVESLCVLSEAGYDIKLSYNPQHASGNATLVDQRKGSKTAGYALSARDRDCARALKMICYKHFHLLEGDWETLLTAAPRQNRG